VISFDTDCNAEVLVVLVVLEILVVIAYLLLSAKPLMAAAMPRVSIRFSKDTKVSHAV